MRHQRFFIPGILFLFIFAAFVFTSGQRPSYAFKMVCDFVEERYYLADENLTKWHDLCLEVGDALPLFISEDETVRALRQVLGILPVSHLDVYSPVEEKRAWQGIGEDTGLRAELVQDYFVVTQVLSESPNRDQIKKGDIVFKINGEYVTRANQVMFEAGEWAVLRLKSVVSKSDGFVQSDFDEFTVQAKKAEINVDASNKVYQYAPEVWVLQLGSFKAEWFKELNWKELVGQFIDKPQLVIDLRGNLGGDFAALLRALSPFYCQPTLIGYINAPRREVKEPMAFPDAVEAKKQFEVLEVARQVMLITYEGYGCFKGKLSVLVDENTGSSAEIFAQAMKEKGVRVWGERTKGEVVMSVWYDISYILGKGYSISVPEATYSTVRNNDLEAYGVIPDRELYYQLQYELHGKDSWIEALR
ncbi:MAG: S41 family peptidase [Bdellovibrionales bacterium]